MNADQGQLIAQLAGTTRSDGAFAAMTKATERIRRLEVEAQSTFTEYAAAQAACRREGICVDVELQPGMAAAFSEWKQRRAVAAAHEMSAP